MRPKMLEISWHESSPIYSCDFQPLPAAQLKRLLAIANDEEEGKGPGPLIAGGRQYRLATAGGDSKVRLWMVYPNIPSASASAHAAATGQDIAPLPPRIEYLTTLSKHTAPVNAVRFSPNGQTLASASDDGNVILWVPSDRPTVNFGESSDDALPDKEHWRLQRSLQATKKHVYDLAWSPDSEFLIAGTADNNATIWKASTGECVYAMREHTHHVQGVTWDPLNEYIATQSSDRSVHVSTFAFKNGIPDVHPVTRAMNLEIRHSRTPSFPSAPRPNLARRASTASETGSVITTVSEHTDLHAHLSAAPMTPSPSVPSTPQPVPNAMNPPPTSTKPGSRRSSFSGSQAAGSPSLSAANFRGRTGRSPSPIPPLPAIRAPPTSSHPILQTLYGEEEATRFFRRLTFSPDGSLLLTPAGQIEDQIYKGSPMLSSRSLPPDGTTESPSNPPPKDVDGGKPTVYIYSRSNLSRSPICHLPGFKSPAVAIRFSPVFYDLRSPSTSTNETKHVTLDRSNPEPVTISLSMPPPPVPAKDEREGSKEKEKEKTSPAGSLFALPYRLLYAVACKESVLLYDTQQSGPLAIISGLHYDEFTDIAWSPDGQALLLSSSDGYCSIIVFDLGELGTVHPTQQHHRQLAAIASSHFHSHPGPSSTASTPIPHSPSVSTMRQSPAPARSEREGSTSSSIAPYQASSMPPLFMPLAVPPPSSVASSVDQIPFTPGEESEKELGAVKVRTGRSESESSISVGLGIAGGGVEEAKRPAEGGAASSEAPKKKRRVAPTLIKDEAA